MKELFAAFNTDFFRALGLRSLVSSNHVETAFVFFVIISFVGLMLEDIGSRIESILDDRAQKTPGSDHMETWYSYLRIAFDSEPIGRRYIKTLVTRLKFELGSSVALILADAGFFFLTDWLSCRAALGGIMGCVILAVYLGVIEAPSSHHLLARARSEMMKEIRIIR